MEKRHTDWLGVSPRESHPDQWGPHLGGETARALIYRHGARIYFEGDGRCDSVPPDRTGTTIKDQSDASRRRCALAFGNAECDWLAMSTHTIHHVPTDGAWRKIVDSYNGRFFRKWGHAVDAWVLEIQERGAPHLHQFHARQSTFGEVIHYSPTETINRKGKDRRIVRGSAERWLVDAWLKSTRQEDDVDARAFNWGGVLELFDGPTGAGNYMAKESSKREQKILPDHYSDGLGRWWWLNPRWEPKPVSLAELDLSRWPWEVPVSRVWQWSDIAGCIVKNDAIAPMENPKLWKDLHGFTD